MKKLLALMVLVGILLVVGAPAAMAGHNPNHQVPPSCQDKSPGKPQGGPQNKHCYPPRTTPPGQRGLSATFPAEESQAGGLTVGMATVIAVGAVGALLVVRRRWVFRTSQR
jgi:hypothetical protein